jgi:hypothetical protein
MTDEQRGKFITRRSILKVLAGGAVGAAAQGHARPLLAMEQVHHHAASAGTAAIQDAVPLAPQFFSSDQMRTLSALTETLIPTDEHSPGAVEAGVPGYIDSFLSTSTADRKDIWKNGLTALDRMAKSDFTASFAECNPTQQEHLLLKLAANEEHPSTVEEKFFVEAKRLTVDGYYNSEVGLNKDLQYEGNEALAEFEGCTHPEHGAAKP